MDENHSRKRSSSMSELLRVSHLKKVYRTGKEELVLFTDLSFSVAAGEMLAVVGESGTGKSTLLHILGTLDRPTSGEIFFEQKPLHSLMQDEKAGADFRGREIGYVWQFHYLLPEFSALENVAMPLLMKNVPQKEALERGREWLAQVNLS